MFFLAIERLAIALIVGGGVMMAACVRPLLIQKLSKKEHPELVSIIEGISIGAWSRYNQYAFISTVILVALEIVRIFLRLHFSYWKLGLSASTILLLLQKFSIDRKLKARLHQVGIGAVGSEEQESGHRRVELLSKVILMIVVILTILPE